MGRPRRWIGLAVVVVVGLTGCLHGEEGPDLAYVLEQNDTPPRLVAVTEEGKEVWSLPSGDPGIRGVPPAWSRDGERLAFARYRSDDDIATPDPSEVVVVDADGSDERTVGDGTDPSWTNDGESLVVERRDEERQATIHVLRADGAGERRLTMGSDPTLSHRGSTVAFLRQVYGSRADGTCCAYASSSIYTIGLDGQGLRRVGRTRDSDAGFIRPSWLPDDSAVAALLLGGTEGGPLVTYTLDGRRRVVARGAGGGFGTWPGQKYEWAPNGDLVAFVREGGLYIVRADGTEVGAFPDSEAIDITWSPDGRKLAFSKLEVLETGQMIGVYVVDVESKERRRLALADGDAAYLAWRP